MLSPGHISRHLIAALIILSGLICQLGEPVKTRQKRDANADQPRMSSENGNLIFSVSQTKNIEFKTSSYGKIKMNDDDLTELLSQIHKNKEEIAALKVSVLGNNQTVTNQIARLDSKLIDIENRVQQLQEKISRKACNSNPCQYSGTCLNLLDSFFCLCSSNWQGQTCAEDVNECQLYGGTALGCQNGALCENTPGSYRCSCTPEWYGPQCTSKYDDCKAGSLDLCVHGKCIDLDRIQQDQPRYSCVCDTGWTTPSGSSACTEDIDECSLDNPPCSQNPPVQCYNTISSFTCGPCPGGWQGNGYSCQDIDECQENNGGCSLAPLVKCMNTMGSYHCGPCPPGYEGDGRTCNQVDACSVSNGGCHPLASCAPREEGTVPICVCPPGYTGNGYGEYGCLSISDICLKASPCVNGVCKPGISSYICECYLGWTGMNCTENINECASNPCQNGGLCTDKISGYTCNCTSGWTGFHCESQTQACGGVLSGLNGTLSYPTNPGNEYYGENISCSWVIKTEPNKVLRITFPYFNLEMSSRCSFDFVQVHDGETMSDHMLGKFCGATVPEELFSSHNALYIWFKSDHRFNNGGFRINWESRDPECGAQLSESHGTIFSPGYPGNYPPNRDCYWTISVEAGLFITFAFGTLSLEQSDTCENDYLEIRDGLLSHDLVIGKYCSTSSPAPLQTSGPSAWIHFHSNSMISDKGFYINYITSSSGSACGGTFSDVEGFIMSPSWPDSYTGHKQCIYLIRQAPNEKINLKFTHMDLESSPGCSLTVMEVKDGSTETAPLIGRYCNSTIPAPIISSSNALWIRFKSDASATRSKFRAFYQVVCGGSLSGVGVIRTPHYPNPYYRERFCEWIITQPEGEVVMFKFDSFNVSSSSECSNNYVEVRDGPSSESALIGKYCGSEVPPAIYSTQKSLYVRFLTDASSTNHGFSATYRSLIEGCGGTMTTPEGTINSPGYPNVYPHGVNCMWLISVQPGNLVRLTFSLFNLDHSHSCQYDYVEIYDNSTDTSGNKIGRYCGRSIPPTITSSDSTMVVLLVTDLMIGAEGFSANYVSINASTACDVTYTEATGVFTSPNYPNKYPTNRECVYTISADVNRQIMLNFTRFSLEKSTSCTKDYVEIRDGGYETSPLFGRFCNEVPPVIISHSNKLWVKFRSDSTYTYDGFEAHWESAATGCGATLTALSGAFTSPNYPMPYYHNSECYWLLKSSSGNLLEIEFQHFDLEYHINCDSDYLAVYNGNSTISNLLAKLCGKTLPAPILSSSNVMYVKLRTDNSMASSGFLANYRQVCEGVLISNRNQGILESLNYPDLYPNNKHCNWTIQATAGNTISYTFRTFQFESISCFYDYVKLYDGPNDQARLIGTYCGEKLPPDGITNGTSLHVVFQSDGITGRRGFQLSWSINGCGGELSGPNGTFNSPGYPMKYPNNRECIWHITTSPRSSIEISIVDFDVEYHTTCNFDVLEIYGGPELSSPRLAQLCTSRAPGNPLQVSSTGNAVTVWFKTDALVNGKGFNATWREVPGGCGGIFQAPNGEIHSPNYPRPYDDNTECSWLIRVDPGHRVFLNFTDFDIEYHSEICNTDSVKVYDGENSNAELLATLCGSQIPSAITSTQNTMFVRLRSDSSDRRRGFSAQFSEACGSSIVADSIGGVISSPLYPVKYPNNQNCSWIIKAQDPFNHVTISFTDFQTEARNHNCSEDFVEILDGDNYGSPSRGRFCGAAIPHPVTSFSNALVLRFVSNANTNVKGFHASYSASLSACGGTLHMENGVFNSPSYPDNYPASTECVWTILSSPGNRSCYSFVSFSLQLSDNCSSDYVEIREGNDTGLFFGRFCGNTLPSNVTSIVGHILWVKFVSDASGSGSGFQATFSHLFGNNIEGTYGQIASPLWPRQYPHHSNYIWKVNVESGHIIEIRILEIDIEDQATCRFDKLQIFDGPDTHFHIIGTYCGVAPPPSLFSFGSTVTIQFLSDNSISKRGFLLEWTAVNASPEPVPTITPGACGGALQTGETPLFLFSPGWPNMYPSRIVCTWVIRSPESTVELNLLSVDIEAHSTCNNDKLVIRDGDNNIAPVLTTICGREVPGPIRSTGEAMFLYFASDGSVSGRGFNASYHRSCGGYLHANRGVITSQNYPENYVPNQNCTWHVMVTVGFTIAVHFEQTFEVLNNDGSCGSGDFIELKNGADESSPPLGNGKFCGRNAPSTMHTTDNELFVRFITDASNEGKGFKLAYEAKGLACGGTIYVTDSDPNGLITSPNYPSAYPRNIECVWTVIVPNGEAVQINFQDRFHIEPSDNCSNSYLELRDGADSNSRPLAKLCGNTLPVTYKSLGTAMYLRFRTDGSTPRAGFSANYSIATCGGTHYGESGIIQGPGYPTQNYPDSSLCEWFFNGPTGHYLIIRFESLDLQNSSDCLSDFVEVREYNASGKLLGTFCNNIVPDEVRTSDSFAYVKFVSDGSVNAKGFRLHYEASAEECGGDINGITGTFKSPNYPNLYPHNRVCEWRITVPEGRRVTLTINDLQLQDHQSCNYDYVAVYNGYRHQSPLLEKLCGDVAQDTIIRSSGNTMKVVFITDGSVSSGGFQATFTSMEDAVCGGPLLGPTGGNFTSPGYDRFRNYTKNLNCEWTIQNPNAYNSSTYMGFTTLRLEPHQNCQNDFIEIRIEDAEGEVISRVCGRTKPSIPLALVAPRIWVHFVSNAEVEDLGFVAEYSFTGCGGIQSGESGVVASPNYPDKYPALSHCAWLLEAPEGHTITMSFASFDLEYHSVCRWDSVTLMNGASPGSPMIGQYCGTTSPGTVQSGSNKLLVIFNADHSVNGGGFYANWTSDSLGCGGYIHADSGHIKSPGWPLNFPTNSRCTWTIQTHESSHFELTFNENFNIPDSSGQCERSYVKVWSGTEETDEVLLSTACGNTVPGPIISPGSIVKIMFQSQDGQGNGFMTNFGSRCGSNFTKPSGRIVSSNYPNKYENNLNCNYTIQADDGMFIVLTFLTFELEYNACKDRVKIFSGASTSGSPLATFCGDTIPAPISSRGTMSINFYTDSTVAMHGFMATYRLYSCGGTFNRTSGTIRSPTHSFTNYHNNMNCTYLLTAEENRIIELKFNEFDVEGSGSCTFDHVSVYDGSDIYAKRFGKFCGKVLPPVIRSSSNRLFLVFYTDSNVGAGGWRASYRQTLGPEQGCGGYLTNATGRFGSPDSNGDGKYDKSLDCVWNIVAPINQLINLTFSSFFLEAQSQGSCRYDFVKIFDGSSANSSLQGTFCGSDTPTHFVSSSNSLTVWFFSDFTVEREGFNATYIMNDLLCGGIYNATSSMTTALSPNYPNSYPPFTYCIWTIDSPEKENVKVKIQSFHLQAEQDCSNNYLEVKDSPLGDLGQAHRYCGTETYEIPEFYSYGRTAVVTFKSQEFVSGNGLSFIYQISNCSREYNQSFGYLKSPGWPGSYPNKVECDIILRAPENHSISLFFHSFHLEKVGSTCYDYLDVRNGSSRDSPLLGTYCGNSLPNPIFHRNNLLHLFFKSDIITSREGYEIIWTSSPAGCGGTLFGDHGSFTSPEYPASYSNNTDCEWTIAAPSRRAVSISFDAFSMDDPGDCEKNFLRIYNGPDPTSPLIRTFCGLDGNIASFNTTSHHVFIKFHADYAVIPSYFRIIWSS
ncbi:LOW QUALITY PROTEIN: cubilin [Bufo gargarizans]|uniref:LOW QUALITY PROTEIN: cubilin n=1 Tax=Bufo gargarizans TaxID=30331 RepID=UPI001CF15F43|nr:LOW QUALITY PROTEIN: cubilin [Bufo gargarizans]